MPRPLAERQQAILLWLADQWSYDQAHPPSAIAVGIGMNRLPLVVGGRGQGGRGKGHRVFNPAQRIISSLTGLRRRGLIFSTMRPDGLTGSAYTLTDEGRRAAEALRAIKED